MTTHDASADLSTFLLARGFAAVLLHVNAVGHFEIDGEVNGHAVRLVLDTGASRTVFAASNAERWGLQATPSQDRAHGVGGVSGALATTTVAELRLGAVRLRDFTAWTLALDHVNRAIEARGGAAVDGVIGGDILRPTEAVIDYARATLYLRPHAAAP